MSIKIVKTIISVFILSITVYSSFSFKKKDIDPTNQVLDIHQRWLSEAYVLTKNCVGFSAPITARAYSYFVIGMYESCVEIMPEMRSMRGQLNGYERNLWASDVSKLNWALVTSTVDYELLKYFFRNMPPKNATKLDMIQDSIRFSRKNKCKTEIRVKSEEYGKSLAHSIINWSKSDGADEAFADNYPESYVPPKCPSCWTRTTPGYQPSLLPYWGSNRQLLSMSHTIVKDCNVIDFTTEEGSTLYQDASNLLAISKENNPEYEKIAEYWDDSPGYSGTPTGHFFSIAQDLAQKEKLPLDRCMELYLKLGVSINEAFISCWRLKYTFNFIRPITYIHRYIEPQFNTFIASPSFPEFPSGHSFQSGAGTEVLTTIFGENYAFTDKTNSHRTDIDGTPRSYSSFRAMSDETSISRFYGGIHFMQTLDISLDYGRRMGVFVANELKCRK